MVSRAWGRMSVGLRFHKSGSVVAVEPFFVTPGGRNTGSSLRRPKKREGMGETRPPPNILMRRGFDLEELEDGQWVRRAHALYFVKKHNNAVKSMSCAMFGRLWLCGEQTGIFGTGVLACVLVVTPQSRRK